MSLEELLILFKDMDCSFAAINAVCNVAKINDEGRAQVLNTMQPQCNHPVCHAAFKQLTDVVEFMHKINKSPEFKKLTKDLIATAEAIKTAGILHEQRN